LKDKDTTNAGSIYVLPPEAFDKLCLSAEPSIDIWALGVILYYLTFGVFPFSGKNEKEIAQNITTKKPKLNKSSKKITHQCADLINGLLTKDPKARLKMDDIYQSPWYSMP
jgi:serine/threonine protein kinase